MAEPHWIVDGENRISLRIQGDTIYAISYGQVTYPMLVDYLRIIDQETGANRRTLYFVTSVQQNNGTLDVSGRRYLAKWSAQNRIGGLAVVGANWLVRSLTVLIFNGASLINRNAIPIAFFQSEEQAIPWIDSLRRKNADKDK